MKFSTLRKTLVLFAFATMTAVSAYAFDGGNGSASDPFLVSSVEDLKLVTGSSYYKQVSDIVLNDTGKFSYTDGIVTSANGAVAWTPNSFSGVYDGNGKYITGLYVTESATSGGLFSTLDSATVKNLKLDFALIETNEYAGIVAGKATGTSVISDVVVSGSVIGKTTKVQNTVGGIIGYLAKSSKVENSASYAVVTGPTSYSANVGGVVGANYGTITKSAFGGKAFGTSTYYDASIGGICGYNAGEISNCVSSGTVGGESTSSVNNCYIGGIAGTTKQSISNCVNESAVSAKNLSSADSICSAGGIVGISADSTLTSCKNSGKITGEYSYLGGIAGIAVSSVGSHNVTGCHNTGAVASTYGVAGGIVGRASASGEGYVTIKLNLVSCFNEGQVSDSATGATTGEIKTVESASVIVTDATSAPSIVCSSKVPSKIEGATKQYLVAGATPTTSGIGTVSYTMVASDSYIARYTGNDTTFAPASLLIEVTVVKDATAVEILSVNAGDLVLTGNTLSGKINVRVYVPSSSTIATAVTGVSVGNKFACADFTSIDASNGRDVTVEIPVSCTVIGIDENASATISVNAMIIADTDSFEPLCENVEVTVD